jgi:HK97 family phage prohead protease
MSTSRVEYRVMKTELRAAKDDKPQIEGYAAVFNVETDLGYVRESIAPGAFKRAIVEKQDVRCLFNHQPDHVLGRTKSGTLALDEDNTGLHFTCDLPDTQMGRDVRAMILRGDVDQCSFGFIVRDEEITYGDDQAVRVIRDADLFDVSPVTYPAYETTSCEARSATEVREALKSKAPAPAADPKVAEENARQIAKARTRLIEISQTL